MQNCLTPAMDRHSAVIWYFSNNKLSFAGGSIRGEKGKITIWYHVIWFGIPTVEKLVPLAKTFHERQFHMCRKTTFGNQCHQHTKLPSFYDVKSQRLTRDAQHFLFSIKLKKDFYIIMAEEVCVHRYVVYRDIHATEIYLYSQTECIRVMYYLNP